MSFTEDSLRRATRQSPELITGRGLMTRSQAIDRALKKWNAWWLEELVAVPDSRNKIFPSGLNEVDIAFRVLDKAWSQERDKVKTVADTSDSEDEADTSEDENISPETYHHFLRSSL